MKTETFNTEVNNFKKELMRIIPNIFRDMKEFRPTVMVYIYTKGADKQPIGVMPDVDKALSIPIIGKKVAAAAINEMVSQTKPIALAFISEAYALKSENIPGKRTEDHLKEIKEVGGIANHPDKQEILIISLETYCMECNIKYNIKRDTDNPRLELSDDTIDWQEKSKEHGAMQNFIKECYVDLDEDLGPADLSKVN